MTLSPPRHSRPTDDAPARRNRRHDPAAADTAARLAEKTDTTTRPAEKPDTTTRRTEPVADGAAPLTRSRRRKHIRAAAGPRPHRHHPAADRAALPEPATADDVPSWPPLTAAQPAAMPPRSATAHPAPTLPPPAATPESDATRTESGSVASWPSITDPAPASVADLAGRLPADDIVDADDVIGEMVALGLDDRRARARYGMSLHGLGLAVLSHLRHRRAQRGLRRAPSARPYLVAALVRCALYLGPLGVAVAAAGPLGRVNWAVPSVVLVLAWSAAQALTCLGGAVARTSGTAAAARLVAGGFAAAAGVWCAFVWVAPSAWLGPDRMLAGVIGVGGLTTLATVTAALVTRAEAGVLRWSVPCWMLGGLSAASATGLIGDLPIGTLLPAAIVVAAVRAYRPVIGRTVPRRKPLAAADVRRALGFLVAGAGQAVCVALLWRAGPTDVTALAAIPLLLAVPALEMLIGWHVFQLESGMDTAESSRDYRRHVRSVAVATVAALLPPLAAGIALAAAAYRVPYGATFRDGVLALAAGTLLGGLLAVTLLLAARGRTGTAATLAAVAPLAIVALPLFTPALTPLPTIVAVFAGAHLLGLLTVAHTATDDRRAT
jgi:hypothetical protein